MLKICERYTNENKILFNSSKRQILHFSKNKDSENNRKPKLRMSNGQLILYVKKCIHQLGLRYEGQLNELMSDDGAYSPFRSILLVLTHDYIITIVYGPTGSDGHEWMVPTRALVAHHFFCRLRRRECCMLGAPSSQPTVPLHKLPPARQVIHRQTSVHERRKWTRSVLSRSGILAYLCTRQHWLWMTVELHISSARHEEAVAREGGCYALARRVLGSEPLSLRTHRHRGRSRPLRSAVVEYQAPSVAV